MELVPLACEDGIVLSVDWFGFDLNDNVGDFFSFLFSFFSFFFSYVFVFFCFVKTTIYLFLDIRKKTKDTKHEL